MTQFGIVVLLSIASGVLYRLGGWDKGNRLFRILGCPLATLGAIWAILGLNSAYWWAYAIALVASGGAVSAYWGLDEKRFGYWGHGLGLSLALLPIAFITQHWLGFGIRTIVLTALITLLSEYISRDWLEEGLRGAVIIATLPLLLI